jgi:hypothetical protein
MIGVFSEAHLIMSCWLAAKAPYPVSLRPACFWKYGSASAAS